jgi:hypothetical protein
MTQLFLDHIFFPAPYPGSNGRRSPPGPALEALAR